MEYDVEQVKLQFCKFKCTRRNLSCDEVNGIFYPSDCIIDDFIKELQDNHLLEK